MKVIDGVFTAYLGRIVFSRFLVLLLMISIIWQMLDLLNVSDEVLAPEGATAGSLLRYVSYSMPQIMSQFTPFAALLAIVFALTSLSMSSEITIMRAAGMSVNRVLFPVGLICLMIALLHFVFQETIAVRTADKLEYWRANEFALNLPPSDSVRTDIQLTLDDNIIKAQTAERTANRVVLSDVTVYDRQNALPRAVFLAEKAVYEDNQWFLENVNRAVTADQNVIFSERLAWPIEMSPDFLFALSLNPERTSLGELWGKIEDMRQDNADYRSEMTSFLGRFSRPLATLIMPLLGAIAGFGIHRQGAMLARAINGSVLGFTYFIVENIALALGKLGVIPAIIGAFFPLVLFAIIGFSIVLAMESK